MRQELRAQSYCWSVAIIERQRDSTASRALGLVLFAAATVHVPGISSLECYVSINGELILGLVLFLYVCVCALVCAWMAWLLNMKAG